MCVCVGGGGQMMEETGWTCSKHVSSDKFKNIFAGHPVPFAEPMCIWLGNVTDSITRGSIS